MLDVIYPIVSGDYQEAKTVLIQEAKVLFSRYISPGVGARVGARVAPALHERRSEHEDAKTIETLGKQPLSRLLIANGSYHQEQETSPYYML